MEPKKVLSMVVLLSLAPMPQSQAASWQDQLETSTYIMALADYQQTCEIKSTPGVHEINPMLPEQPDEGIIAVHFASSLALFYWVNRKLEKRPIMRGLVDLIGFGVELYCANLNAAAGLGKQTSWYVEIRFEF